MRDPIEQLGKSDFDFYEPDTARALQLEELMVGVDADRAADLAVGDLFFRLPQTLFHAPRQRGPLIALFAVGWSLFSDLVSRCLTLFIDNGTPIVAPNRPKARPRW